MSAFWAFSMDITFQLTIQVNRGRKDGDGPEERVAGQGLP